jgi:hypothetical protein
MSHSHSALIAKSRLSFFAPNLKSDSFEPSRDRFTARIRVLLLSKLPSFQLYYRYCNISTSDDRY